MGACVWSALQSVPEPLLASGWLVHKGPLEQGGWWPVKGRRQRPQVEVEGTVAETHLLLDSCWLRPYVPTMGLSLDSAFAAAAQCPLPVLVDPKPSPDGLFTLPSPLCLSDCCLADRGR